MSDLTYTANANGYMLYYKGKPIGGAGVVLPRDRPLRGNQARNNMCNFAEDARMEIHALDAGRGQQRFRDAMLRIDGL